MKIIEIHKLSKSFGTNKALQEFTLQVDGGQIVGLLGPNGAGKSTLIKALVGGVRPTSGSVEVFGKNPLKHRKELVNRFGYMSQASCLYEDLSVKENIHFFARLHMKGDINAAIDEVLDFLQMTAKRDEQVQNLSGGMKTRVSLACAMIHKPDVLFLDEPTAGLDPSLKRALWELFAQLANNGKTLFISTHLMDEAILCDNLAVIRRGKLLAYDAPKRLIAKGGVEVMLRIKGQEVQQSLSTSTEELAGFLHTYGLDRNVTSVQVQQQSLEDIIISIVDKEKK